MKTSTTKSMTILFILGIAFSLLYGGAPPTLTPTLTPIAISTQTLTPIPSLTPTATQRPNSTTIQLTYQTVYDSDIFVVKEAYINNAENIGGVPRPADRINGSAQTFFYYALFPSMGDEDFTRPVFNNNGTVFQFEGDYNYNGGHIELLKNNAIVWKGDLVIMIGTPIHAIRFFGNEIAFDYTTALLDQTPQGQCNESIVYTLGNTAIDVAKTTDYKRAFAPFPVGNKLTYIAKLNTDEYIIVFDGEEIKLGYTFVHNDYMGDAVSFSVRGNGEMIDFYAKKGDAWYHVQAGSPDAFSHP